MEITTDVLDIAAYERERFQPATLVPRDKKRWLVRDLPIGYSPTSPTDRTDEWGLVNEGDKVRIPLYPYLSHGDDPIIAVGLAFELGFKACNIIPASYEARRLHISLGYPVHEHITDKGDNVLRFWLGFAYVIREIP